MKIFIQLKLIKTQHFNIKKFKVKKQKQKEKQVNNLQLIIYRNGNKQATS